MATLLSINTRTKTVEGDVNELYELNSVCVVNIVFPNGFNMFEGNISFEPMQLVLTSGDTIDIVGHNRLWNALSYINLTEAAQATLLKQLVSWVNRYLGT